MLIPDLLDQKKLVEKIKEEKQKPLYPNTQLWSAESEPPPPYYKNTELHASTPLEYGGKTRMTVDPYLQKASYYTHRATDIVPELVVLALKKLGLPISGDPNTDFGTFLVYALTPGDPAEFTGAIPYAKAFAGEAAQKANLTAKPAYAETVNTPEGKRMRLYHGTKYDFPDEEIKAGHMEHEGIYLHPQADVSNYYSPSRDTFIYYPAIDELAPDIDAKHVKKYLLSPKAKVLDKRDPGLFTRWLEDVGIIDWKSPEAEEITDHIFAGELWRYDKLNDTRITEDAVLKAKELGYDVIIIPDYHPQTDQHHQFSYIVTNPKALETGASDEALQARWDKYKGELEFDETFKPEELKNKYHSLNNF